MSKNPFAQSMVKMALPANMGSSISLAGFTLESDEDGIVTVPREHVDVLKGHGLTEYIEPSNEVAAAPQPQRPKKGK